MKLAAFLSQWLPRKQFLGVDQGSALTKAVWKGRRKKLPSMLLQAAAGAHVSERLRSAFKENNLGAVPAALNLADERVELHEFKLPKLAESELESALQWEIKHSVAGSEFAYQEVLKFPDGEGTAVQCFVASKDLVQEKHREAVTLGLLPEVLEVESTALIAATAELFGPAAIQSAAIVDLGYSSYRIIFVNAGRVLLTRSLYFGVKNLLEQVAMAVNLSEADSLALLKRVALGQTVPDLDAQKAPLAMRFLQESLYSFCEEYRRSEAFLKEERACPVPDALYLCGGAACFGITPQYLQEHLVNKRIEVVDPFRATPEVLSEAGTGPLYACAFGLSCAEGR